MESLTEMQEKIAGGDVEAALAFTNNPTAYVDKPEYDDSIPAEETLETIQPQVVSEESEVISPEAEDTPLADESDTPPLTIDPLEVERKRVDDLEKAFEEKEARLLKEAKEREDGLLKQIEEARNASAEEDEDYFFGSDDSTDVDTSEQVTDANTATKDWEKEFTELNNRLSQKEIEDNSIREFDRFWGTENGKNFRPDGMDAEKTIKTLDAFYNTLTGYYNNDQKKVMRTLYDLRNPETKSAYETRLQEGQIEVPKEFDKLYDNWNVNMYADGLKLDQVTGKVVRFRDGKLNSLEDAYYLMNKDKLLFEAKMETFEQINSKMREHQNAATTINPSQTASFADSGKLMDSTYRRALLTSMRDAGFKAGSTDVSMIKDPDLRRQASELIKYIT